MLSKLQDFDKDDWLIALTVALLCIAASFVALSVWRRRKRSSRAWSSNKVGKREKLLANKSKNATVV